MPILNHFSNSCSSRCLRQWICSRCLRQLILALQCQVQQGCCSSIGVGVVRCSSGWLALGVSSIGMGLGAVSVVIKLWSFRWSYGAVGATEFPVVWPMELLAMEFSGGSLGSAAA
ncbi:hypothetical protein CsSME_00009440 [Camellia sinensis var. sinensis]